MPAARNPTVAATDPATTASGVTRPVSKAPNPATATMASAGPVIPLRATGSTNAAAQDPDNRGVDPGKRRTRPRAPSQGMPEGDRPHDEQRTGEEDRGGGQNRPGDPSRDRPRGGGPEERGKGEERTGQRLCRPVPREEGILADPPGFHDTRLEEGQDDVAPAEDQGPGPVERLREGDGRAAGRDPDQAGGPRGARRR